MPISKTPSYNLKAVLHETGLKADVLRAWERRYGIPAPERTQGGHRLYSEFDVALLKWLSARQNEGLSISRAVELWKEASSQGRNPLEEASAPAQRAVMVNNFQPLQQAIYYPPETNLDSLRSHWLAACLNYNETAAEQALNQAFGLYPVETVCLEVLQRGMSEIGTLWYENRASVQQEHFASSLAMRRLDTLLSAAPSPTRNMTVLVGCPAEEWHTFTPLLISLFLRRRGLNVIYLGANVPSSRFDETIAAIQPHLVVLASQQLISAATLRQTALNLTARGVNVAFGGRIFIIQPEIKSAIPAHFLGDRIDAAIENVEHLLSTRVEAPRLDPSRMAHAAALSEFILQRPAIEAGLNDAIKTAAPGSHDYLEIANRFMGDNIVAALQLGNITYMNSEIDWLRFLLKGITVDVGLLDRYLDSYAQSVRANMPVYGKIIVDWAKTHISA
jgi:methanogenic corrinoid protein MtbC1